MAFTWNISRHFVSVRQTYPRNFSQRRIWLFRRCRINSGTNTTPLRRTGQRRGSSGFCYPFSTASYELVNRWHKSSFKEKLANIDNNISNFKLFIFRPVLFLRSLLPAEQRLPHQAPTHLQGSDPLLKGGHIYLIPFPQESGVP